MRWIFIACISGICVSTADFEQIFGADYQDALEWVGENKPLIQKVFDGEEKLMLPVVFPELLRYSILKDFFETQTLALLYVNLGADYADFSIGRFQMKPSFAEELEGYLETHPELSPSFSALISFADTNLKARRQERLARLEDPAWQLCYARAFFYIVKHRFPFLSAEKPEDQIRFFAAAYNHGFLQAEESIRKAISAQSFPYGPRYPGPQYAYSEVAVDFFLKHYFRLMTP